MPLPFLTGSYPPSLPSFSSIFKVVHHRNTRLAISFLPWFISWGCAQDNHTKRSSLPVCWFWQFWRTIKVHVWIFCFECGVSRVWRFACVVFRVWRFACARVCFACARVWRFACVCLCVEFSILILLLLRCQSVVYTKGQGIRNLRNLFVLQPVYSPSKSGSYYCCLLSQ